MHLLFACWSSPWAFVTMSPPSSMMNPEHEEVAIPKGSATEMFTSDGAATAAASAMKLVVSGRPLRASGGASGAAGSAKAAVARMLTRAVPATAAHAAGRIAQRMRTANALHMRSRKGAATR